MGRINMPELNILAVAVALAVRPKIYTAFNNYKEDTYDEDKKECTCGNKNCKKKVTIQ